MEPNNDKMGKKQRAARPLVLLGREAGTVVFLLLSLSWLNGYLRQRFQSIEAPELAEVQRRRAAVLWVKLREEQK